MSTSDTMNMPAMKPPPGVVPNVENPPNGNAMALSILSVCLAISTISMALRFYSRLAVLKIMELQDYLLLASFGLYVAIMAVFYRLGQHPGWLIHQWNLRVKDMVEFMHVSYNLNLRFFGTLILMCDNSYRLLLSCRMFSWPYNLPLRRRS